MNVVPTLDAIASDPHSVAGLPAATLKALLARSASVHCVLTAELIARVEEPAPVDVVESDIMLKTAEACMLLCRSPRWLYRNSKRLPFTRRLSARSMVFSKRGIERWLATRKA